MEVCTNNKIAVLLSVLLYCYSSTVPRYAMMGATPSSAVQQTAYLEALDEYPGT